MTIGIIGAGNMGSAMIQALIDQDISAATNITAADTSAEKLSALKDDLNIKTCSQAQELIGSDILILAVKPQSFADLTSEIKGQLSEKALVISIMAGTTIDTIASALGHEKVVRAMPNTPLLVNEGVIGWYTSDALSAADKETVKAILSIAKVSFEVEEESQINDVTSLSGSGPGFFFHLADQWQQAVAKLNLPPEQAQAALIQTLKGSIALLESSDDSASELCAKVTSKGGTTAAGLDVLKSVDLADLLSKTHQAAVRRGEELS